MEHGFCKTKVAGSSPVNSIGGGCSEGCVGGYERGIFLSLGN